MADETTDEQPEAEAAPKAPARKRAPKKAAPAAEATADASAADEADEAEAKPKARKRTPAKKAATEAVADAPAEAAEPVEAPAAAKKAAPEAPSGPVEVHAHAKYVRTSARKARLVCDHIRGKSVDEAYAILAHTPRHVARDWQKLLRSAVANAEHNHELVGEDLRIASVRADEGPTLKRFRPRAMGRASSIRKRTSHLSITLAPKE